jgi:hypothetical protein
LTADAYSLTADEYWRWISRKRRNLSSVVVQLVEELSGVSSAPVRGKSQMDFAIPESLHVLKKDVRRREVRAIRIPEGTSEIMHHIIARACCAMCVAPTV